MSTVYRNHTYTYLPSGEDFKKLFKVFWAGCIKLGCLRAASEMERLGYHREAQYLRNDARMAGLS